MKMWKVLYLVTIIGVILQTTNGQKWDIEKMEQCPCANDVIEDFLETVTKTTLEIDNGQKLKLLLWQLDNKDCTVHVQDDSPQPGKIEISMVYSGSLHIGETGESDDVEDQQTSDDEEQQDRIELGQQQEDEDIGQQQEDIGQQQEVGDIGQQQVDIGQQQEVGDIGQQQVDIGQQQEVEDVAQQQEVGDIGQQQVDIGQQQEDGDTRQQQVDIGQQQVVGEIGQQQGAGDIGPQQVDIGQQQIAEDIGSIQDADIEEMLESIDLEQLQQGIEQIQDVDLGQEQADIGQEQSEQSDDSHLETGSDEDYSTEFSFTVDVNTGKLSESTGAMINRRKREIMPFETVIFKIKINFNKKPDSDDDTGNDQIKSLLKKGLEEYWLAMAFCLLDVKP